MTTNNQIDTSNLPVIRSAPTRGDVTIILYADSGANTFLNPYGKKPGDFDFGSIEPSNESTNSKAVLNFSLKGQNFRLESSGTFPTPQKQYATVGEYFKDFPETTVKSNQFFKNGTLFLQEVFTTPILSKYIVDQQYDLDKLTTVHAGNDVFIGSTDLSGEDDWMNGYGGDDTFYGNNDNANSDLIHGGDGNDTAVYRGKYAEYTISASNSLFDPVREKRDLVGFLILDKIPNRDGDDQLYQIERLQFSDYIVSLPDLKIIGTVGPTSSSSSTVSAGSSTSNSSGSSAGSATTGTGVGSGGTSGSTSPSTASTNATTPTTTPAVTTPVAPIIPNGTEKTGSDAVDRLQGGSGPDVIRSGGGNDLIVGSDGNDYIDGGTGIDQLTYSSRAGSISFAVDTGGNVQVRLGSKTDTVVGVERISFTDKAYALDLDGSAGKAAKAVIAAFGKTAVSQYLGIALTMIDKGSSVADLAKMVIDNKMLPSDNSQFVQAVFNNVVGRAPNALELLQFKGILDRGEMNTTQLLTLAANTSLADAVMSEIAIAGVALEFVPTLA